jgi:TRAP-type C4-dicarboxylate transport system substrate-binding protein
MSFHAFGVAAAVAFVAGMIGSADAADVTLKFGTINAKSTRTYKEMMVPLKEAIERDSNGRIAVEMGGLGEFGRPTELFGLMEQGKIDAASTVQGYHPGRFPLSSVMELPLIYETAEQGTYALWKLYEEGLLGKDYAGFKVLSLYTLPPYGIFASSKVETLRDLRGLRVRSPGLAVGLAMSRLGMVPVGLPLDWIGPGLTQKLIDGIAYGWDSASTTPGDGGKLLIEQVTYMVDARFAAPALMIVMNKASFDKLPADLQQVIDKSTGLEFSLRSARQRDQWEAAARERVAAAGKHQIVPLKAEQRAEISRRVTPTIDEWVADMTRQGHDAKKLLERARALVLSRSGKTT